MRPVLWRSLSLYVEMFCCYEARSADKQLVERRDQFRAALSAHWRELGIDVVLSPVGPTPAPKLETAKYWNVSSCSLEE
jgi:hypothetical protein